MFDACCKGRIGGADSGKCDVPEVDVSILVFIGLTKHPSGELSRSNCLHRDCRSSSGVHADMSSM